MQSRYIIIHRATPTQGHSPHLGLELISLEAVSGHCLVKSKHPLSLQAVVRDRWIYLLFLLSRNVDLRVEGGHRTTVDWSTDFATVDCSIAAPPLTPVSERVTAVLCKAPPRIKTDDSPE